MIKNFHPPKFLLAVLLLPTLAFGQVHEYEIDKAHSFVGFTIVHLAVAKVDGEFEDVSAEVSLDPADLTSLRIEAIMQVASINTKHEKRDGDLRGEDFFAVETYPEVRFKSTGVTDIAEDGSFKLHGDLTIKDVTKPIVLDAEMRGPVEAWGSERLGFSASTEIDRFDYGLKWNSLTEAGGLIASREVQLVIEVELKRPVE